MAQYNGLFKDHSSPERPWNSPLRRVSSPIVRSARLPSPDLSPSPEPPAWSSAVGHASTGKSGRVIERLQGDIDRLHREQQLLIFRSEESEKANEALAAQNLLLQDRNHNYEQAHETNLRQMARKERQVEELREELRREKSRTATAEETARVAAANEEEWREKVVQAQSLAAQKETEYDTIAACRNLDNKRHSAILNKMRSDFEILERERRQDSATLQKLEIVAEQQRQTIGQLGELTRKMSGNYQVYRSEIDTAIAEMRKSVGSNDAAVSAKLDEMTRVAGQLRWLINFDKDANHRSPGDDDQ